MKWQQYLISILLLLFTFFLQPIGEQNLFAQTTTPTVRNEAVADFPRTVTFSLELPADSPFTSATLIYDIEKFSCVEVNSSLPIPLENGTADWTWQMVRSSSPPPGANISWSWELSNEQGDKLRTDTKTLTLIDERFNWQTVSASRVNLHWYDGVETGQILLDAAVAALARLELEMGITLTEDVDLYIYGDSAAMRDALLYVQEWAGGVAFTEYNTILIGVSQNSLQDWGIATVRHELAHLVVAQFGRSCVGGSRPNWLDEGLAMYAEGEADESIRTDLANGIADNSFEPVRSLNGSFPAHDSGARAAYSQSFSLVSFLLDTYGQEKMKQLLHLLAAGATYDHALEQLYGFNSDGLELAWRESIGAPPRIIPPTPTPLSAAAIPTFPPLNGAVDYPTPAVLPPIPTTNDQPAAPGLCTAPLLPLFGVMILLQKRRNKR